MNFTLRQISEITGIPIRRVRHILDQEIIAHQRWHADEEGWTSRRLNLDGAILAAAACHLVNIGFGRGRVREIISVAERTMPTHLKRNPLNHSWLDVVLYQEETTALIEIGEGSHIQLVAGTDKSGWHQLESDSGAETGFYPIVTTVVDVLRIRKMFA